MKILHITNENGKLSNSVFAHITFAPKEGIPESNLPMDFLIQDPANYKNSFAAKLITFARCKLKHLSSIETYLSAGIDRSAFIQNFIILNKSATYDSDIAVYIYKKREWFFL